MDFSSWTEPQKHSYHAYGKINKLLITPLYYTMCREIPYYTLEDVQYSQKYRVDDRLFYVYAYYFPYKRYMTIEVEIMRWYKGKPKPDPKRVLFHKNTHRRSIIKNKRGSFSIVTMPLKRMVPLLGKVKDIINFKPTWDDYEDSI